MDAAAYEPQRGDIFLTRISGALGAAVELGQALFALAPSIYTHAGIFLGDGLLIAAQPAGARIDLVDTVLADRPLAILKVPDWAHDRRDAIARTALSYTGHPYGFEDYAWIGLARLGLRPGWLRARVASDRTMICSAFVERMGALNGIHLFDDGRLLGAVTPGALSNRGTVHHIGTGPWSSPA